MVGFALLVFSSVASAAVAPKGVTGFFGSSGVAGGQLTTPQGVAVNQSNGNVYAVDGANNRVVVFDSSGKFVRAFGADVVAGGPDQANEAQVITVAAASGNFTLSYGGATTANIAATATAAQVQSALNALSTISAGGGSVAVTGGPGSPAGVTPYRIVFNGGPLAQTDVEQITAANISLAGGTPTNITAATANAGVTGFENCVAANGDICKSAINSVTGGAMNAPQGIAINQTSGDVYVTDQGNLRVQQFDSNGNFLRAFGQDVDAPGSPDNSSATNAAQTLTITATTGKYTLEFQGKKTGELALNSTAAQIQTALTGLTSIGSGNASVAETAAGVFKVVFLANLAANPEPNIVAASGVGPGNELEGGTASVATTTNGSTGFEVCVAASNDVCQKGVAGNTAGALGAAVGYPAVAPAGAPNAGDVLVADTTNLRVQEFSSSGAFVRAFGFDVAKGGPGNTGTAFEVCAAAAFDACKVGVTGSGNGQFATGTPTRVAEDAAGNLYTVESLVNFRVQKFTLPGNVVTPQGAFDAADLSGAATSAPTDVAVNPANGDLLVNKAFAAGATASCPITGAASAAESRVVEVSSAGALEGTHGTCAAITPVSGLAVRGSSGDLYVSSTFSGQRIYVLNTGQPVAPTANFTNISGIGAHEVTLSAFINPGGPELSYGEETGYRFEYKRSADPSYTQISVGEASAGNRTSNVLINQLLSGLQAATSYDVRLVATKSLGSGSATATASFTTASSAPDVTIPDFVAQKKTAARFEGTINPNNSGAAYRFEYVADSAYQQNGFSGATRIPSSDASVGSGTSAVAVSQSVSGLQPGTKYHLRLVAVNGVGVSISSEQTFTTEAAASSCPNEAIREGQVSELMPNGSTFLPDCIGVEQVSLSNKGNQPARFPYALSSDGSREIYLSTAALADSEGLTSGTGDQYVATRGADGWTTNSTAPPADWGSGLGGVIPRGFNLDLSSWAMLGGPLDQRSLGIFETYEGSLGNARQPYTSALIPQDANVHGSSNAANFNFSDGVSADMSHFFFRPGDATATYLPGDLPITGQGTILGPNLYIGSRNTEGSRALQLAARDSTGKIWGGRCGVTVGFSNNSFVVRREGAISPGGSRTFLTTRYPQTESSACSETNKLRIIKRVETSGGVEISELISSECTRVAPICNPADGDYNFEGASADGTKVYFTTTRQLVNSDLDTGTSCSSNAAGTSPGCDLYLYDSTRPAGSRLTQVSAGDATDPTPGSGAGVFQGIAAISTDGSHAYYLAKGVLTTRPNSLGAVAKPNQLNLYMYERDAAHPAGKTAFIATMDTSCAAPYSFAQTDCLLAGRVSFGGASAVPRLDASEGVSEEGGDGHMLVFPSRAHLTPNDSDGAGMDLFRYDAATEQLERVVTAAPGGSDNAGKDTFVTEPDSISAGDSGYSPNYRRQVSEDGKSIVVMSEEALTAEPSGSLLADAYVWRNGTVAKVPGTTQPFQLPSGGVEGALFQKPIVSADGRSAAIQTGKQLLASDGDSVQDIYVLRTGGGFPVASEPVHCAGEACQGPVGGQPVNAGGASETFTGPGNQSAPPPRCKKGFSRKHGKCVKQKTRHKKHGKSKAARNKGSQR